VVGTVRVLRPYITERGAGGISASRITIIGAGSHFTPGVLRDAMNSQTLSGSKVTLMDLDPESLKLTTRLAKRMIQERRADLEIEATTDRKTALKSADFVITTILVGGLGVCKTDIDIPMKYGVYQTVGDTVGPGGLIRAFRTIPAMVEIAKDMESLCPDAWLFNYSNPLTCLSIAVRETTDVKMVGLCHGIRGTMKTIATFLGMTRDRMNYLAAGINHLTWILDMRISGKDCYPKLREILKTTDLPGWPISSKLFRIFGYFPSPGDRHIAEFFPYFLTDRTEKGARYGLKLREIDRMMEDKRERTGMLQAQADGSQPLGDLTAFSGEEVIRIIKSIVDNRNAEFVVNIPNEGFVPNLPDQSIIETHALVGSHGMRGIHVGKMPDALAAITHYRIIQQELTTKAALEGNKQLALQALLLDPMIGSVEDAESMLDELLRASSRYLPQFKESPLRRSSRGSRKPR